MPNFLRPVLIEKFFIQNLHLHLHPADVALLSNSMKKFLFLSKICNFLASSLIEILALAHTSIRYKWREIAKQQYTLEHHNLRLTSFVAPLLVTIMADGTPAAEKKNTTSRNHLPRCLALLSDKDRAKFLSTLEVDPNPKSQTYGQSFMCVHSVLVPNEDGVEEPYDLKALFTLPLRTLCKNVGIANCGSKNKFECRRSIATFFSYQDELETNGLKPTSHAGRLTSTLCRAINVVFSEQFIESFKTVNDIKTRRDHETRNTNKQFWIDAALAHNYCGGDSVKLSSHCLADTGATAANDLLSSSDDDNHATFDGTGAAFDSFSKLVITDATDPHLQELISDPEINLLVVTQFDTEAFRKKITDLFHIRRIMKENMTASGTHDSDPWNFVETAMNAGKKTGLTKLGVYYFYVRCNEHPDMDSQFQPFLDPMLLGDTVVLTTGDDNDTENEDEDSSLSSSGAAAARKRVAAEDNGKKRSSSSTGTSFSGASSSVCTKTGRTTRQGRKTKKAKMQSTAEYQQVVTSMLTQSQDDFRQFMTKQDAFVNRMLSDADKKNERAKLQFRLEIAKAMGNMDEMKELIEEAKRL